MFAYNGKNQVEVLLDKYQEYMKEGSDSSTRKINAALVTHTEVVQLLIRSGADLTMKDTEGHVATDFDYRAPPLGPPVEGSTVPDKEKDL